MVNASSVIKQLGFACAIFGVSALACAFYANLIGDQATSRGLLLSGFLGSFLGVFSTILFNDKTGSAGPREGVLLVVGFWILIPLLAVPPFFFSGVSQSLPEGLFESVSNLTTTGSSLKDSIQPEGIRAWRAVLQLFGGIASVVLAVVVLAALNLSGPGVHRSHLLTLPKDDFFGRNWSIAAIVALVYSIMVLFGWISISAAGETPLNALTRSVAAVTTSSTLSGEGGAFAYTAFVATIVSILLFLGATNIAYHADLLRPGGWKRYLNDREAISLIVGIVLVGGLVCLLNWRFDIRLFAEALSYMSTSGMSVTGVESFLSQVPQPIPELLAFVGGAALSTAGGIKIARVLLLMNRAGAEFKRLAFSKAMAILSYQGRKRQDDVVIGVWVYLIAYIGANFIVGMGLSFSGVDFESSFRASVGALSNTGPLVDVAVLDQAPSVLTLLLLSAGCILGRIEVLVLLPLLTVDFWRR